ncbi:gamma-glutamylcyclotransferase [uncultured Kiloniella sp.]|uniref:gamma-glutamylcyclotransferase n=1 Tax=uncultured Kiloniella sp. TaxID=1133091 RepID=UPI002616D2AF|nr:gamma-glutamylcyclotransferase [uncultured Kiloniella sp.]
MSTPELRAFYDSKLPLEEGQDFWVFGYGSLMWNPGFPHVEVQPAVLDGFHRHFCIYSFFYRGTPECPGLVLGLDQGGSCVGMAYKVPAAERAVVMDYLFEREMISGVYHPGWYDISLKSGEKVIAATFVADTKHNQYAGRLNNQELISHILQGVGSSGQCFEYLDNTVSHLKALNIDDPGLEELLDNVVEAQKHLP